MPKELLKNIMRKNLHLEQVSLISR